MKYLVLLFLGVVLAMVYAASDSNPTVVYTCDARDKRLGCDAWRIDNGVPNRRVCLNASRIMSWVSSPKRTDCYKLFVGDESSPSTTYVPGQYINVNIRVLCHDLLYRGILLYAVNSINETKVGDWAIPNEDPPVFTQPWKVTVTPLSSMCANTIMHYGAGYKSYLNVLKFQAPPAGTGKITFRCLIKYGDANVGEFYWPNLAGDVSLTEAVAQPTTNYELTQVGQSCSQFCAAKTPRQFCSQSALLALQSPASMDKALSPRYVCNYPILSGCGNDVISYDNETQYCYYADPTCATQKRAAAVPVCDAKAADVSKFCVCVDRPEVPPVNSNANSNGATHDYVGAGSSLKASGLLNALLLLPFFFSSKARYFVLYLVVIFGIMGSASGHNWINSKSRSPGASGVAPCKPPLSDLPHAQVGPNQMFSIEWMTAHGGNCYFVVLHSKDAGFMAKNSPTLLDDYIKNAPNGSDVSADPKWQRYHRIDRRTLDNNLTGIVDGATNVVGFYEKFINPGDAGYIVRPAAFGGRVGGIGNPNPNNTWQVSYKPADRTKDVRVSYYNAKYPWIEAVARFALTSYQAVRPDAASFIIPGRGGAGRYTVQWLWSGYRDCIDVDYKPALVTDVYGYPTNNTRYKRIDHCMMKYHFGNLPFFTQVVSDMAACLKTCDQFETGCYGVNLVPVKAPSGVYPKFKMNPFQKFGTYFFPNIYGADFYAQWNESIFLPYTDKLFNAADRYICYGVVPLSITLGTEEEFTTTNDPEDPLYYSTCYYKLNGNMFADYESKQNSPQDIAWRANGKCIDCPTRTLYTDAKQIPYWKTADTCVDCDREPSPAPVQPDLAPFLVELNTTCDGVPNNVVTRPAHYNCTKSLNITCVKQLDLVRSRTMAVSLAECRYLASRDAECGNTFSYLKTGTTRCYCYKKIACCQGCSRNPNGNYDTYEIATQPDPTCATGKLSTDRTVCCSATCATCAVNAAAQDSLGFCSAATIRRPCSQFSPPCKM